jgi:hypothetical protein
MVRTQIQLLARQHQMLKQVARAKHLSLSEVLRRIVDNALEGELREDKPTGASALLETCGTLRERSSESVARNHDQALVQAFAESRR